MKKLFLLLAGGLFLSCEKERLMQPQEAYVKIKLMADYGTKGVQPLDSVVIHSGSHRKDTANVPKIENDLAIKSRKGLLYTEAVKNIMQDSIPLTIQNPTLSNYTFQIVSNVPYNIEESRYLALWDAVKEVPNQEPVPGYIGIGGSRGVVELFWKNQGYNLDRRFSIVYLK
jgi:hypothetical protein